jgi:hypothetical protein
MFLTPLQVNRDIPGRADYGFPNVLKEINGIHVICGGIVNHALVEPREVFMAALMREREKELTSF